MFVYTLKQRNFLLGKFARKDSLHPVYSGWRGAGRYALVQFYSELSFEWRGPIAEKTPEQLELGFVK